MNYIAYFIIVPKNKGSKISAFAFENGINNSTVLVGKGTVKDGLLNFLGFFDNQKEIVVLLSDEIIGNLAIEKISNKFKLDKPNNGIVFSMKTDQVIGVEGINTDNTKEETMSKKIIFTIVNRGLSNQVIECANKAGATGGTILYGRGSGIKNAPKLFNIEIEPEKEIILIIADSELKDGIVNAIKTEMEIDKPNKGIIFVIDLYETIGLYSKN